MVKKTFIISFFLAVIILSIQPQVTLAKENISNGTIDYNGFSYTLNFIEIENKAYIQLTDITRILGITATWQNKEKAINLQYPDRRTAKLLVTTNQLYKTSYKSEADFMLKAGRTYISIKDLSTLIEKQVIWDSADVKLIIYTDVYQGQGESLIKQLPYQGFTAVNNMLLFNSEGLSQVKWQMAGELIDLRLIEQKAFSNITETKYAAYYQTADQGISTLSIVQRVLPNNDHIFFITANSAGEQQEFTSKIPEDIQVYASNVYIYQDKGELHTLLEEKPAQAHIQVRLAKGYSLDQWVLLAKESLAPTEEITQKAWQVSKEHHQSVNWITENGTHRKTPDAYQEVIDYRNYNLNLQASSPNLIIESVQAMKNRFLEDLVHNTAFTLKTLQGSDGFWRMGVNVAYLNRAYQLGPDFIDTRMSVDASLFLLRYGLMYGDTDAVNRSKYFKKYFNILKEQGLIYQNEGILYPDYYSEQQYGKSLVSLNHALYEMNYLYTLYNWTEDLEAKELADELLRYINKSNNNWLTEKGDLFYALSPKGEYYGKDYLNITYRDLFVTQGILRYMGYDDQAITNLYTSKGWYLFGAGATDFESQLTMRFLYDSLGKKDSKVGELFMSYPMQFEQAEGFRLKFHSYGTYHVLQGVSSINYNSKEYQLSPDKKYLIIATKDKLYFTDKPIINVDYLNGKLKFILARTY